MSCTQAEITEAFRAAMAARPPEAENAMTTEDLVNATGKRHVVVRGVIRALIAAGEWEAIKVDRRNIGGDRYKTNAFRPVAARR